MQSEEKIQDKTVDDKNRIYNDFDYKPYVIIFNLVPILIWTIIIYFMWWKDKHKFHFGYIIFIPLIFPYIYTLWSFYKDLTPPGELPIQVTWPFCLEEKYEKKKDLRIYANWDWTCGNQQLDESMHLSAMMGTSIYNICYPLLLFMIVSSATSKNLLENSLLRKFSAILLILGFMITTFTWMNIYGLYTLAVIRSMGIFQSMAISCLTIIFIGYGKILLQN
jgi:hypothetical protein